jgi:hypothetical protein
MLDLVLTELVLAGSSRTVVDKRRGLRGIREKNPQEID